MRRAKKAALLVGIALGISALSAALILRRPRVATETRFIGAVITRDSDPKERVPIANARVTVRTPVSTAQVFSDASGGFNLTLKTAVEPGQLVSFTFWHPDYEPLTFSGPATHRMLIARMSRIPRAPPPKIDAQVTTIANVRLRYSTKATTTMNVGTAVKSFDVVNIPNIPCNNQNPCSPDGKWRASIGSATVDAGEGNQFRNERLSCIAGPCSFTNVESNSVTHNGRMIEVSVRNWSETTTFIIEAEVTRTMVSDLVRQAYPFVIGDTMSFTIPVGAQGTCLEAEVNKDDIVFPLGPGLNLSWATCTMKVGSDQTRLYRCDLKPGYRFP
jgi:hypothetical protein